MNHRHKSACLGTLLALFALAPAAVFAQGQSGFYVGLSIGETKFRGFRALCADFAQENGFAMDNCDAKDTAWKIFGGYQYNRNFGLEVGYVDLGKWSAEFSLMGATLSATQKAKGFEFFSVLSFPLAERFSVYGKAGLFRWDTKLSASFAGITQTDRDKDIDFTYGLGLKFDFTLNLSGRLEVLRYNDVGYGERDATVASDLKVWSFGLKYRF